jgi:hypothetical protein
MKGVRRLLSLGLVWLVAAVVASVIAWQGVGLVGDQVTDRRPATFTEDEVEAELAEQAREDTSPPTTPPGTGDQSPEGPTTTTAGDQSAPEARTYRLGGGTVVLRFGPAGVTLEQAVPKLGFEVRYQPVEDNGWRVEFVGDEGRSRVEGWWDGGPQERVDDDVDDDGGARDDGDDDHGDDGGDEHGGAPVAGHGDGGDAA